ncbi:Phosphatidylinositol 4-kinase [Fusarium acuminatum]|uniref:1-phosphatidylinositol 4-kinase n=1 Tax=Fusarium acuminatum TaxID=5515 RepID=A0ABZ2WGT4_9HYPO
MTGDIRSKALQKIASLSATSSTTSFDRSDLDRLCRACHAGAKSKDYVNGYQNKNSLGRVPMSIREFEVLIALCKTAPKIKSNQSAQRLSYQLFPYILEAHIQIFVPSPFFRKIDPSPSESLAFHVTGALLSLGINYDELQENVTDKIWAFVNSCRRATESIVSPQAGDPENPHLEDAVRTVTIAVALLGFLDAAAAQADFWRAGGRLALIKKIRELLSEPFLIAVETALSTIRNCHSQDREIKEWKRYLRHYASSGRPLGAMLLHRSFACFIVASTSLMVKDPRSLRQSHVLDIYIAQGEDLRNIASSAHEGDFKTVEDYATLAIEEIQYIEGGADFIRMGSPDQQSLAYAVKAAALISYLNCALLNEDAADAEILMNWLQETLDDSVQMADPTLASVTLKCLALICQISPSFSSNVSRILPRFIVQDAPQKDIVTIASNSLAYALKMLSKDAVIGTLYTLGNVLSPGSDQAFGNGQIDGGAAALALEGGQLEFRSLLKLFSKLCHTGVIENQLFLLDAVRNARTFISANLRRDSQLFDIYFEHLLDNIIGLGDVHSSGHTKESDVQMAANEIAELLHPLAVFMSSNDFASEPITDDETYSLLRDAWFNIVVHGFTTNTDRGKQYMRELRMIAIHSPPLVAEQRGEQIESDIELNTVLQRGMSGDRESLQKKLLSDLVPTKANDIRSLSYRKVIFLQSAYLMEILRADSGDCTKVLSYFLEPSMSKSEVSSAMEGVAAAVMDKYIHKTQSGTEPTFSAHYAAEQLATIFCGCCHRIERVQQAAFVCADRMLREIPSVISYRSSLFALIELLSLMWSSCLEAETDVYTPRSTFTSELGGVTVQLSDDYDFRRWTMDILNRKARVWVNAAINVSPLDVKGILQTYLSEFSDEGAYGHVSLGRSFALEMGSIIPSTDNRLQSMDKIGNSSVNTASAFIAQYTTRQEYRYGETLPDRGTEIMSFMNHNRRMSFVQSSIKESANATTALAHIEARILSKKSTSITEVRDILRRAAALLCRTNKDEAAVAHHLVSIPFALFTKQSINLGVSLWLGVINENPRQESRLLNEIAQQWEFTLTRKVGLFSPTLNHIDPFFLKEEFAPSELEALAKKKQLVHDILAPHTRLLQFFASHYNATRLGSPDIQKVFLRMLDLTLEAMKQCATHPMAREIRFQIIMFGLRVLRSSTTLKPASQWRLKERILTAGLSWFKSCPKWSFGSNLLQMKTEIRLISDVLAALQQVSFIGAHTVGNVKSLQSKEQLLDLLLRHEQCRLVVWVNPLNNASNQALAQLAGKAPTEAALLPLIRTAWWQDPAIAIELAARFPFPRLQRDIRFLLLTMPEKAIFEPEALHLIFGGSLPDDVGAQQLKYLLYWEPVNPVTAVTMFLPAYQDHPFVIQYAMRALESHSVDVTFFYVPQIVQSLRYDSLGYVKRYILETAQFSQLFAHQIIWNMKANSYKDDDAQVPDEIKPTLDTVMAQMIDEFATEDRVFFEREFAFFDEVTDISGKLKPYIKLSKPEKTQKIEEELRKIKVEVGVYLPSNPDGVVIGIDRKSGKALQSHAKAPYMATFRIQKNKGGVSEVDEMMEENDGEGHGTPERTVEVWQSAIFKVGDDCRQDVLALQMIAAFRGIFHDVGLDVYVFPYRVTATAPGCGVIDVLPNSISRDMLGREAVNGLYDYFISKYGNENSLRFQRARSNFVKSMAAYSVISYLLQFKDRHNGNIMIDDAGHILHIDFGFCFDIAPGGVKFERAPFKLTTEMVAVMGGSMEHQSFKAFEELCIKAFLASRQYCEKLSQIVLLMMDSGLDCFKPESVKHFRERFVLDKSEREAANFMKHLIKTSYSSYSTSVYDHFQLLTNGIPY